MFPTYSEYLPTLYVDKKTGQVFVEPGPDREKLILSKSGPKDKKEKSESPAKKNFTSIPDAFAHRPDDTTKEKLTIYSRIQFRAVSGSRDSLYSNGHSDFNAVDWNFRRLRLGTSYENDWWGLNLQLRLENMLQRTNTVTTTTNVVSGVNNNNGTFTTTSTPVVNSVRMTDNRGYVHEAFVYAKTSYAGLRATFGMINTQFTREYLQSSANFVTLERSIITNAIPQFDLGFMVTAAPLREIAHKWEKYLQITLMVGNGKGAAGDYGTGRRQDLTSSNRWGTTLISPTYYGRIQYNVFGGLKRQVDGKEVNWQEGEEIFQRDMKWSIGSAMVQTANYQPNTLSVPEYTPGTTSAFNLLNGQQSNPDRGTTTTTNINGTLVTLPNYNVQNNITTPGRPSFGLVGHTYDTTFTYNGFYLSGAFTKFTGAASNQLKGWHTTLGYNIKFMEKFYIMPILKYEEISGDFHRDGNAKNQNDILKVYWAGVNFFGDKHHFKIQLYYQILGNKFDVNPNTGNYMAIDDRRIYLQLQGNFWFGNVSQEAYNFRPE